MTRVCTFSLLAAALAVASPALAAPITGGFSISGYVNASEVSDHAGVLSFQPGSVVANPTNATGTFAGITAGTALNFSPALCLYLIHNESSPTLFTFDFDGQTFSFQATSFDPGPIVKIAGIFSTSDDESGYGEVDFTAPTDGVGNFSATYDTTPVLMRYSDGYTPEPGSLLLMGTGLLATGVQMVRRRRAL